MNLEITRKDPNVKSVSWLSFILISVLALVSCAPTGPTLHSIQRTQLPSPIDLPATDTVAPTLTPKVMVTETLSRIATRTLLPTLRSESVKETMQPMLQNPMNCVDPCFLGITPGKTSFDKVRTFFSPLGLAHREGIDPNSGRYFYAVAYDIDLDSNVTLYIANNLVENITIMPEITNQEEGSPREWIAYSPETLINKFGKPSRVEFGIDWGGDLTIVMILYFHGANLIALYSGYNMIPGRPHSPRLCPLTASFDHVRLWMGANPPDSPQMSTVSLEEATSLSTEEFTQLMLGDAQQACFTLNGDALQ